MVGTVERWHTLNRRRRVADLPGPGDGMALLPDPRGGVAHYRRTGTAYMEKATREAKAAHQLGRARIRYTRAR